MVERIVLSNGVRIVHESLPHVRSCALGIWVQNGSRHEPELLCGVSHFIEHMLFKGTEKYTAAELAEQFDSIGGQVNAFTTKENTCYYIRALDIHLRQAADLLADMYFNSSFNEPETDLERGVILEEIGMYEDTPEDLCNELLYAAAFDGSSLSRPILGTKQTLAGMSGQVLSNYQRSAYTPENTLISISGSYSREDLDYILALFGAFARSAPPQMEGAEYRPASTLKRKEIEQNHLIVGFPGLDIKSEQRYTMQVLSNILGAGMSSRLFQNVREKHGLCYTIYSFASLYTGVGMFGVYTATGRETEMRALELIRREIDVFKVGGPSETELTRTKEQLKANVLMGLESTTSRMSTIARNELTFGRAIAEEEIIERLDAVTCEQVVELSRELLDFDQMSFSAVGEIAGEEKYMEVLKD